jgi:hypothetical protein
MAIQFACPQCHNPIEVDDEFADQSAGCPYCDAVVTVPAHSTYQAQHVPKARPAAVEQDLGAAGFEGVPTEDAEREAAAKRWGTYSLICGVICVLLMAVSLVVAIFAILPLLQESPEEPPDTRKVQELIADNPLLVAASMGMVFFALAALALGLIGLRYGRTWQAIVGVSVGGFFVLCQCGSIAFQPALASL